MRTKKAFDLLFVSLFCFWAYCLMPLFSWAACTGSSPNWISTADYSSVKSCVSQAAPGDVITVSGNATWTSTLEVTRGVQLIGSGNPTITGGLTLIYWIPNAAAQTVHDTLTISGFTFDANNSSLGGAGIIRVYNNSTYGHVNLIVTNNTIRNASRSARGLYLGGAVWGVASSNIFDRIPILFGIYGNDFNSWNNLTQAYGVAENFYVEDNTIQFSSSFPSGYSGWTESGQGGRVVVRYNTWDYTNADAPGEFWDIHGLQTPLIANPPESCQNYSTMVSEYYGNKIINQVGAYRWMAHRGGWMLMFNNTLAGNTSPYNGITQYYCNSCQQMGSFNQKADNTYAWRNLANGTEKPLTVYSPGAAPYGCASDPIIENADFFNYNAIFNGSTGVGCGPLAARPSTCTTGVAYWATNQSCSDLSGMVGKNPIMPISGTLYKCTATNTWTAYYTPYQYPHPMRESSTPTAISAPRNLRY